MLNNRNKLFEIFKTHDVGSYAEFIEHHKKYEPVMKQIVSSRNEEELRDYVLAIIPQTNSANVSKVENALSIITYPKDPERIEKVAEVFRKQMNLFDNANLRPGLTRSKLTEIDNLVRDTDNFKTLVDESIKGLLANTDIWTIGGFNDVVTQVGQFIYNFMGLSSFEFFDVLLFQIPACCEFLSAMAFHHTFIHCVGPVMFIKFALSLLSEGNFTLFLKRVRNSCVVHVQTALCQGYSEVPNMSPEDKLEFKEVEASVLQLTVVKAPLIRESVAQRASLRAEAFNINFGNFGNVGNGLIYGVIAGGILVLSNTVPFVPSPAPTGGGFGGNVQVSVRATLELMKGIKIKQVLVGAGTAIAGAGAGAVAAVKNFDFVKFFKNGKFTR